MKVPPKRKGNPIQIRANRFRNVSLNESPSEKEGKCVGHPSTGGVYAFPSMKVPPKRKGNKQEYGTAKLVPAPLNESPSEKEGKWS